MGIFQGVECIWRWSSFGTHEGDCCVQYYVPYLSGIQIYGEAATLTSDSHAMQVLDLRVEYVNPHEYEFFLYVDFCA